MGRALPVVAALVLSICVFAACGRTEQAAERTAEAASEAAPSSEGEVFLTPKTAREGRARLGEDDRATRTRAQVVELEGAGAEPASAGEAAGDAPSPGAPTDDEVRAELKEAREALANFKQHLNTSALLQTGPQARVLPNGMAVAPENAPDVVKRVILAANEIARFPYKWGGGHGKWQGPGATTVMTARAPSPLPWQGRDCSTAHSPQEDSSITGRPAKGGGSRSTRTPGTSS